MQLSIFTYQFFPLLVTMALAELILVLHQSTISSVSKYRFLLMRSTPNSVVCNLSKFFSNSLSVFMLQLPLSLEKFLFIYLIIKYLSITHNA